MRDRSTEEKRGRLAALIGVLLDVGVARVVIDGDVQVDVAERKAFPGRASERSRNPARGAQAP
jgi:hypothetical protein